MMSAAMQGRPVIATGVLLQTSPVGDEVLSTRTSASPKDIKGKTVAITQEIHTQIWRCSEEDRIEGDDSTTVAATARPRSTPSSTGRPIC